MPFEPKHFANELAVVVTRARVTDREIVHRFANSGKKITAQYIGQVRNGHKRPSIDTIDLFAQVLQIDGDMRRRLHIAAARDAGYDL